MGWELPKSGLSFVYSRREQVELPLQSPWVCWMKLLEQCQRESRDHSMMSHLYTTQMLPRIQYLNEDVTRVHKKVQYLVDFYAVSTDMFLF